MEPRSIGRVVGLWALVMLVPGLGLAQRFATASASSTLVLRVPPRGSLAAPKQLSRVKLPQLSRLDELEQVGLFEVGVKTTWGTGNSVLVGEWSSSEERASALCSLSPVEGGIAPRPPCGSRTWPDGRAGERLRDYGSDSAGIQRCPTATSGQASLLPACPWLATRPGGAPAFLPSAATPARANCARRRPWPEVRPRLCSRSGPGR